VADAPFVPDGFEPPTSLATRDFVLEPLGPKHNESDHRAWTSSIEHIRSTPGFAGWGWPPEGGMSLEKNLADLEMHANDFAARRGFTFTVRDPLDGEVIGCVYIYPSKDPAYEAVVRSWVTASKAHLDGPLADAVASWLREAWPWERVDYKGR